MMLNISVMIKDGEAQKQKSNVLYGIFFWGIVISYIGFVQSNYGSPPSMALGLVDWRYPDYIVKPLPPCPRQGVFAHPRNCTWYYRCHQVGNLNYYRRFYFQCENGAVFSDFNDQCLFPKDFQQFPAHRDQRHLNQRL
ncbi:hypothetical protein Anas_02241 [Armadillidium nasatum]|uniref:Chitin-binding type-2 domain-containing protein n=1 Tax=Armadillidium nasatum TaxID=96803 RepID=A0A5N5T0P7_9CRUS|nr:hypothetical protein Anas_02241 [Armadillidium nasatum]